MLHFQFTEDTIHDLVLKYADESFNIRDALNFETLIKKIPEHLDSAQINRNIRVKLQNLPKVKAAPGFELRLYDRIAKEI